MKSSYFLGGALLFAAFANQVANIALAEEQINSNSSQNQVEANQVQSNSEAIQELKESSNQDIQTQSDQIMKEINKDNLKEILAQKHNKFIYFYRTSKQTQEEIAKVYEHAQKMKNGLNLQPYQIDIDLYKNELAEFLKERNPQAIHIDKQIEQNTFLLTNQFDDIWFWEFNFINFFYGDLLEQIFNFYQGPQLLFQEEQIVMNQSTENDLHIILFTDDLKNSENTKRFKVFRKFNTKNTSKYLHLKYWIIEDKELAKKFKIDSSPEAQGDIYTIRKCNMFNQKQKNIKICDYDYHSEKILSHEDIQKNMQGSFAKILQIAFNSPIQVHDYMSFANLSQQFRTNLFVVYCDRKADPKLYDQILRSIIKARKSMPINLKPDEYGQLQKTSRDQDVVFVLTTTKNLIPVTKILVDKPQALFITPDENFVDLLNNYLPKLEKIEGLSQEEYLKKSFDIEQQIQYGENDNENQKNKKDTLKLIYSPDRFIFSKTYQTDDKSVLTNPDKIVDFVKGSVNGELKYYWDSESIPKCRYSQKITGEDFDKRILNSKKDALVLIYHPVEEKNRKIKDLYEEFVRNQDAVQGLSADKQLVYAKYNGINESQEFKSPQKLPQILYFKQVPNQDEKDIIPLDKIEELLVKSASKESVSQRLRDFVKQNRTN